MAISRSNMGQQIEKPGKVRTVMEEFKEGELHSGSKKGPVVKDRKQAIAIALSEAGMSKPKKNMARGGGIDGCAMRGRTRA